MVQLYQNLGHIVLLLILLCCSAFFSGSETAFFSLSRKQLQELKHSKHKFPHLVCLLVDKPYRLLGCFLFGNMVVNVLYFASASILIIRIEHQANVMAASIVAFTSFFLLILLGEVFPKSLAFSNSKSISLIVALPTYIFTKILAPLLFLFRYIIVEPVMHLFLIKEKYPKPMSTKEFRLLIEASHHSGLISPDENKLLTEIINLGLLKIRHVMQPRVDIICCQINDSVETARGIMLKHNLTKIPVYVKDIDNIIGLVHLRDIILDSSKSLKKQVQKAAFVPEQKTVESLLDFFRNTQTDTALVVDEYGGIAGLVTLEDIAEELLGSVEIEGQIEPIEKIGPFEFRISGNLAIHDWADAFGINIDETRLSTIGGLVTALLGKIPEEGDTAFLKNLKFSVEKIHKRRIKSLILRFEPLSENDK
ncbi:MAG: hemolysin family protein [Planctomycetota bacterium]